MMTRDLDTVSTVRPTRPTHEYACRYWGQLMAAALLGSIPVALIYFFFVDYYVAGLTSGSVKT